MAASPFSPAEPRVSPAGPEVSPAEPGPVVFVHIEKTAGKTVRGLLRRHFGSGHCELYNHWNRMRPEDLAFLRKHHGPLRSFAGHACMPHAMIGQLPGARLFTFLRDPIDRALSAFQYGHQRGRTMPDFEAWARDHANFLCRSLTGIPRAEATAQAAIDVLDRRIGFVGLQSDFDASLVLLRGWLNLPGFEIVVRTRNRARSNHMRAGLVQDPENLELLRSLNGEDLRLYEHAVAVFENQKRAFGATLDEEVKRLREARERGGGGLPGASQMWGRVRRDLVFRPAWKKRLAKRAAKA